MSDMTGANPLAPDGQALFAIRMLHSFLPVVSTAYYFISWIFNAARADGRGQRRQQSGFRAAALWLMFAVLVTYVRATFACYMELNMSHLLEWLANTNLLCRESILRL